MIGLLVNYLVAGVVFNATVDQDQSVSQARSFGSLCGGCALADGPERSIDPSVVDRFGPGRGVHIAFVHQSMPESDGTPIDRPRAPWVHACCAACAILPREQDRSVVSRPHPAASASSRLDQSSSRRSARAPFGTQVNGMDAWISEGRPKNVLQTIETRAGQVPG